MIFYVFKTIFLLLVNLSSLHSSLNGAATTTSQQQRLREEQKKWLKNSSPKKHHHRRRSQTSTFRPTCDGRAKQQKIKEERKKSQKTIQRVRTGFVWYARTDNLLKTLRNDYCSVFIRNTTTESLRWAKGCKERGFFSVWSILCCFMTI